MLPTATIPESFYSN